MKKNISYENINQYGQLTKPAVCYLKTKGRMHVRKNHDDYTPSYLKRISRDHTVSKGFKIRCQLIADWYLAIISPTKNSSIAIVDTLVAHLATSKDEMNPYNTVQFFTPSYFPFSELFKNIKPDAYVSRIVLRYTIKRIFTTLSEEYWEEDSITALHIYILCPNNQIIIYLKRTSPTQLQQNYAGGKPLHFHMATRNQLYGFKQGKSEKIKWITLSSDE